MGIIYLLISESFKKSDMLCRLLDLLFKLSLLALLLFYGFRLGMGNEVLILKLLETLLKGSLILPDLILQSLDLTFHVNGIPYKYKGFEAAAMAWESLGGIFTSFAVNYDRGSTHEG